MNFFFLNLLLSLLLVTSCGDENSNSFPVISMINDLAVNEDSTGTKIFFLISDEKSTLNCEDSIQVSFSDLSVVDEYGVVKGGNAPDCFLIISPKENAFGVVKLTLTLSNGQNSVATSFDLTVVEINDPTTLSQVEDVSMNEDTPYGPFFLTLLDPESKVDCSSITKFTSDNSVIETSGIVISGTSPNCSIVVTNISNISGSSTITLSVSDGEYIANETFIVLVNPVDDTPVISIISDQRSQTNISTDKISFSISDVDSVLNCSSSITKSSENTNLLPVGGMIISGTAPDCELVLTPASNQMGSVTVSLSVSDRVNTTTMSFTYTVFTPWTAVTALSAPAARSGHRALWTGREMMVWGGNSGLSTGGLYQPDTDTWTATSLINAPEGRYWFEMLSDASFVYILGGANGPQGSHTSLASCGKFNPDTNTWSSMASLPESRNRHSAVWTGSKIIVWGGRINSGNTLTNTGHIYNPDSDSWSAISIINAPEPRANHYAIWTGSKMIIWGGTNGTSDAVTGGIYNLDTDTWSILNSTEQHLGYDETKPVWMSDKMFIWGGSNTTGLVFGGKMYDPSQNIWSAVTSVNQPSPTFRMGHSSLWTGTQVIIWGGNFLVPQYTGGTFDPLTNSWTPTSTFNVAAARHSHSAVWTGEKMIIWGGVLMADNLTNTGSIYTP